MFKVYNILVVYWTISVGSYNFVTNKRGFKKKNEAKTLIEYDNSVRSQSDMIWEKWFGRLYIKFTERRGLTYCHAIEINISKLRIFANKENLLYHVCKSNHLIKFMCSPSLDKSTSTWDESSDYINQTS